MVTLIDLETKPPRLSLTVKSRPYVVPSTSPSGNVMVKVGPVPDGGPGGPNSHSNVTGSPSGSEPPQVNVTGDPSTPVNGPHASTTGLRFVTVTVTLFVTPLTASFTSRSFSCTV